MTEIREKAYAKINISLDVTGRREDGYHDMVMVMQTVSLWDDIAISLNDSGRISASSNLRFIPNDQRNLAVKAALRYLEAIGESGQGMRIDMKKQVPVGAGMGGGSSDAAAVLRGLNKIYGERLSLTELESLAGEVGSDTVFCIAGGTALAEGRGELLTELPAMPDCVFAICKPDFSISTPELFRKLDSTPVKAHPDTKGILRALEEGSLRDISRRLYNVFEDVEDRRMRTVAEIKSRLLDFGAQGAVMTGTGSAVFGIFSDEKSAEQAKASLSRDFHFCALARPQGRLL